MKFLVRCGGRESHGVCGGWTVVEKPTGRAGFDGKEAYGTDEHECFACLLYKEKGSMELCDDDEEEEFLAMRCKRDPFDAVAKP